jgi:CysZ protein
MSSFFKDLIAGFSAFTEAIALLSRLRLWTYVIFPGLISIAFGGIIIALAITQGDAIGNWMERLYPWETGAGVVATIADILGGALIIAAALLVYKYVILILVSPFMSPLSEKVERYARGEDSPRTSFSLRQVISDIIRGIRINVRNMIREIIFTIFLLLAGFIPLVGLLSPFAILIIQAYYAGFGNMDFTLERHFGVKGSVVFVRRYKGLAVSNGLVFIGLLAVPVVGLFFAPSLCTIAATLESAKRIPVSEAKLPELV